LPLTRTPVNVIPMPSKSICVSPASRTASVVVTVPDT